MNYCYCIDYEVLTVDLHNMKAWSAWNMLDRAIALAPKEINEVVVIHGYNNGTTLKNMVRNQYKNKRVIKKDVSWNEGRTSLFLS